MDVPHRLLTVLDGVAAGPPGPAPGPVGDRQAVGAPSTRRLPPLRSCQNA